MKNRTITTIVYIFLSLLSPRIIAADSDYIAPESASAVEFIDVFRELSGSHPGLRKGHASGICAVPTALAHNRSQQRCRPRNL